MKSSFLLFIYLINFIIILCNAQNCDIVDPTSCSFKVINAEEPLPEGYQNLADAGFPNIILDNEGRLAITDSNLIQGPEFALIQGVSASAYGEPICAVIVDCASSGNDTIVADIENVSNNRSFTPFTLYEVCSNPGVFFGCVNTQHESSTAAPEIVTGDFGDEIKISYTSVSGSIYEWSVWLRCRPNQYWSYEEISSLLIRDGLVRNIEKLEKLKKKILKTQELLFESDVECEDIGQLINLAPAAISSFDFLECIGTREDQASEFLGHITGEPQC